MNVKKILSSRIFLYVILGIAVTNLLGYASLGNSSAVIIMAVSGLLTSYFTRNMVVVLAVATVCASVYAMNRNSIEGLENKEEEAEQNVPKVDRDETLSRAYKNLDSSLSSDGMKELSADTEKVFEQHKQIMSSIDNMKPILSQANNMLKTLGTLTRPITSILEKLIPIVGSNPEMAKESPLSAQQLGDLQKQIQNLGAQSQAIVRE